MRRTVSLALALALALSLGACSGVDVTDYSERRPTLDVTQFFSGRLTAHGVVKDRGGRVIRSFNAEIEASWQDGVGTLDEQFVFDDGERQQRVWILRPAGRDRYTATAGDVTGEGELRQSGNSIFLDYVLQVPWRGGTLDVRVDDRMYLVEPGVLINESRLSKFGVRVGAILLVILRAEG